VQTAIKGIRQMPPRGGNPELNDTEVARAVVYMANQAGAQFNEPAAPSAGSSPPASGAATAAAAAPTPQGAPNKSGSIVSAAPAAASVGKPAAGAAAGGNGKADFDSTCVACHGAGVAGAPKVGDKAAWAPRIKQGVDALHQSALKGKNAMPPKGGNPSLPDADVIAAVDYMVSQSK
jgi:cytochrome c5